MGKKSDNIEKNLTEHDPAGSENAHVNENAPYQVVARRYRPLGFEQLVGQPHVSQALSNAIATHRIGHAYLFTGARGVGKTSTARIFAKALNCIAGPTAEPCNECDACIGISAGEDVDVLEIDGASNRGIDEIRQLRQNVSIRPSRSRFKIYIIDEVHMLTREAFNALLKTLEEPPNHVKFIFCTTEATKIPITILSRCQRFDFAGIDSVEIAKRLAEIAKTEGVTADEGVFDSLARRAAGSMRDGQSLLEQLLSFADEHITLADIHGMLGTADDQRLFRLIDASREGALSVIFEELDAAASEGGDVGVLIEQLMGLFRDLMVAETGGGVNLMHFSDPGEFERVRQTAKDLGLARILASLQILDQTHGRMRYSTQARTLLEMALVRISSLDRMQQIADLIEQIRSGKTVAIPESRPHRPTHKIVAPAKMEPINRPQGSIEPENRITKNEHQAASSAPEAKTPTGPLELSPAATTEVWRKAAAKLPMITAGSVEQARSVVFESPDTFLAKMPDAMTKSLCEKEAARIQNALGEILGRPVKVRFELTETEPAQKAPAKTAVSQNRNKGKLMAETSEIPFIQKVEEMFDANLVDVIGNRESGVGSRESR